MELEAGFGPDCGLRYGNGDPVIVGDRLEVEGVPTAVTVRMRVRYRQPEYYGSYRIGAKSCQMTMADIAAVHYRKWVEDLQQRRITGMGMERTMKEGTVYIMGLEDYDTAIYKTRK